MQEKASAHPVQTLLGRGPLELDRVAEALVADGILDQDHATQLTGLTGRRERREMHPFEVIARHHWKSLQPPYRTLTAATLAEWLAQHTEIPYYTIDPLKIDVSAVTAVMSYAYAKRFNILAVEVREEEVVIATAQPFVREWEEELVHVLRKPIVRVLADPEDIRRYLVEFYTLASSVHAATDEGQHSRFSGVQNLEQLMEMGRAGKLDANDQHVVNIVDWLLHYAFIQRASDIHLEPRREQGNVRFRIDGVMHLVYQLPASVMAAVVSRIKILGRMDLAEKRRPQDGRLKTRTPEGSEIELRLSTMPTAFGEKLVMRIFDPDVLVKDYTALGFGERQLQQWHALVEQPYGIILVTGPTGSGKTTTLYSTLKELATDEVNVCTIEDPIEMVEPSFNQMQVQPNIGLSFADGVRTLLRQDPDIIMVGEIRDRETAEMAIQAALTGHLVFSTLHTNDSVSAVTRLLELGVPPYLINATVLGVLAQRLVRTLCPHCKSPTTLDAEQWRDFTSPWRVRAPERVFQPVGCLACRQTGFLGRVGMYELLSLDEHMKRHVRADVDLEALRSEAVRHGLKPMLVDGAQKVAAGKTTMGEVLKVAPPRVH